MAGLPQGVDDAAAHTGRCYCGATRLSVHCPPLIVAYCHCIDCRRWTGGPVAAFAAFAVQELEVTPARGKGRSAVPGIWRWNCPDCGSPIAAEFDYLPGQVYIPLGILDRAAHLPPEVHCHAGSAVSWLHISDDLPRHERTARDTLKKADHGE